MLKIARGNLWHEIVATDHKLDPNDENKESIIVICNSYILFLALKE